MFPSFLRTLEFLTSPFNVTELQNDFNSICNWTESNDSSFNHTKSELMVLSYGKDEIWKDSTKILVLRSPN